jgi:hypothetical protein
MKPNKQNGNKQIDPETLRLIRRTRGVASEIARAAKVGRSHVSHVVRCGKPPGGKIHRVLSDVLWQWARRYDSAAFRAAAARVRAERES